MAKSLGVYFFILYISTYFIGSAILMATWNYTIPKIAKNFVEKIFIKVLQGPQICR